MRSASPVDWRAGRGLNMTEQMSCARHCLKHFICINLLNCYNNPERELLLLFTS